MKKATSKFVPVRSERMEQCQGECGGQGGCAKCPGDRTRRMWKGGVKGDNGMSFLGSLKDAALRDLKLKGKRGKRGKLQSPFKKYLWSSSALPY